MEKLDKPQSKEYGALVMWASDLEEIFSELGSSTKIEFVADDIKFESVEEFIKESRGRKPKIVTIKSSDPYLILELHHSWARLYVSSSELLPSGLFHKIDLILSRCERKPKFFFGFPWVLGSSLILSNISYLPLLKPFIFLNFCVSTLTFLWLIYVMFIRLSRFSIVFPMHREERPSFFRRNMDSIVIAVISALLGAVGGAAATKMADKIWPSSPSAAVEKSVPQAAPSPSTRPSL